jgi:hydroxyacyl-ACP dehydratase HTD2-like protein with hotdog domain
MNTTTPRPARHYEDVAVGDMVTELLKQPTALHIFRYSAITWNAHRIHYEKDYAAKEGHPDVLVQAPLHGAYLSQMVSDWIGPQGRIHQIGWANRGRAIPGDTLTCSGKVISKRIENGIGLVELEIIEKNQHGDICAVGQSLVSLPSKNAAK